MTKDHHNVMMFVTHVGAYGPLLKIWAHVNHLNDAPVEALIKILKPRFDHGKGVISPHTILKVGTICCVLHNNHYYRAKVLSIRQDYSISVHLIDYGNVELVHPSAIRLLEGSPEAIELQLMSPAACGFAVTTLAPFLNAWDPKIVDHINRLLRCHHYPAVVSAKPIRRLLTLIFNDQDFFEYVISSKMALPATPEQEQFLLRYGMDDNSLLEYTTSANMYQAPIIKSNIACFNNNNNNMGLSTLNIASLPKQIVGDTLRQPKPLYVVPPQRNQQAPTRTQENLPFKCRILEKNQVHQVRVSHIDDGPARFSVQLQNCAQELESLMRNINSHPVEPVTQPQLIGYVCLGRSTKDGRLRRAVIKSITEGATETGVYYVDYGDCDVLSYSDIYELPTQYVNPRVLSVRFCLSGVRDLNVTPEMKEYFGKLVKDKLFALEVQPVEDTPLIQYCSLRDGDKSVLDLLKEAFPNALLTWRPANALPKNTRETIFVAYVESCKKFFVHLEKEKAALDSIQSYLADNIKSAPPLKSSNVKPGLKCLAHCNVDDHWYRAEVQSVDGNYVTVHYVDYGNDETIASNRLRSIRSEQITKHPAQAIQCILNGFDAEPCSPDLDFKFEKLVLNKPITMTVIDVKSSILIVDLQDNQSASIGMLLKNETQRETNSNQQVGSWKPSDDISTSQNIRGKSEESDRWNQKVYQTPSMSLDTSFEKSSWRNTDTDVSGHEQKPHSSWNSSQTEKPRDHYRNESFTPRDTSSRIERVDLEESRYTGRGGKDGSKGLSPIPPRSDRNSGLDNGWTDKNSNGPSKGNGNYGRGSTNSRGLAQDAGNRRDFNRSNTGRSNEAENERFSKNGRPNNPYDGQRARGKFNESGDKSGDPVGNQWDTASTLIATNTSTLQIPPANITLGATKHCEIVFVRSPSEFYVQLCPDNSDLDQVMTKIAEIYETGGNVLAKGNLAVGMSCVAQYSDDLNWYRAVIQSVGVGQAEVRFVDYGNTELVTLDKIKELQADLVKLPTQAIACKLLAASKTQWNPTELSQFNVLTDLKRLAAEFVAQTDNVYEVLLRPIVDGVAQDPYINEKFCSGVNLMQVRESFRNKNQMGPVASSIPVAECASPSEKWSEAVIEAGSTEKIMVTWLYSPDNFYCQLVRNYDAFKNMMVQIQTEYTGKQPTTDALEAGSPVIAFFADDGGLYRAEILEHNQAHGVKVRYVDFGNLAVVQRRQIFRVERKFMKLPRLALNCSLKNVIPPNGAKTWSGPQIQSMDELFNVDEIVCTFHQMDNGRHAVSLDYNGMNLAEKLVSIGLAAFNISPAIATSEETVADNAANPEEHLIRVDTDCLAGQTLRVKISKVENVNKFHIQLPSATASEKIVDEYMANMDPKVMPKLSSREVCIGAGCLIQSAEGWKRAVVINCSKPTGYQIRLIDSGAIDEIPLDCMIALPGELAIMQKQAVECCLKGVTSSVAVDQQLKTLVENKEVIIYVDNVDNNRLVVELYDENGQRIRLSNQVVANEKISPLCPMPIFNSVHRVICPHIDNSESIWLKRSVQADVDAALLDELYNYYTTAGTPLVVSEGKLCAAQSADGNWYRAKIVQATETGAIVHFIDYGNTEEIPRDLLKELEPQFLKQAQLAIQTSLMVKLCGSDEDQQALLKPYLLDKEFLASIYNIRGKWVFEMNVNPEQKLSEELQRLGQVVNDSKKPEVTEPENLVVGGKFQVQVTLVESPTQFWIQQVKEFATIDDLQAKLQQEIVNYEPIKGVPEDKLVCAALFSVDNLWYRAEVIDADEEMVTVRFIDYGNTDVIVKPNECIRHLPESMKSIKWYATKCKLNLVPIGSDDWPESVCERFESLTSNDGMPAVIIADGNPSKVDLYVGDKSISDILEEENLAVKISAIEELINELVEIEYDPRSAYVSHINGPNEFWVQQDKNVSDLELISDRCIVADMFSPVEDIVEGQLCVARFPEDKSWYRASIISHGDAGTNVIFIDYGNSAVSTEIRAIPEDIASIPPLSRKCCLALPEGVDQWSEAACRKFCELASEGATIFLLDVIEEGETATVRLTLQGADIVETDLEKLCVKKPTPSPPTDEIPVVPAMRQLELHDQEVFISHITCLHAFWVQRTSSTNALDHMATQLSELDDENYPIVESVEEGMLCIALFPEDSLWYRAQVICHGDAGTSVLYIDYGNSAVTTELRKMPDSLATMPPLAKKCELVRPAANDQWCSEADQEFQKLADDGNTVFLMNIVEEAEISTVKLTLNGEDISNTLASLCLKMPVPIVEERLSPLGEETSPNVIVSHVVSPAEFWIQAESKIPDLEAIADHLVTTDSFLPLNKSQEGIMCAAKFPEDGLWYRAKILCHGESETEVLYIDYGNSAVTSELKALPEDIVAIPPLSKHCALKMPEDIDNWSQEACEKFIELVADGATLFGCSELHGEAPICVSLTVEGKDVTEILTELCPKKSHCKDKHESTRHNDSQCDSSMVEEIATTLTNLIVDAESNTYDETSDSIEIHTYKIHECQKTTPATVKLPGDDIVGRYDKSLSVEDIESGFETGGECGISQECVFEDVKSVVCAETAEITSVNAGEIVPTGLDVIVEEKSSEISSDTVSTNDEGLLSSHSASMINEVTDALQKTRSEPVQENLVDKKPFERITSSPQTPKTPLAEKLVAGVVTDHRILSLESDEVIKVEILEPTSTKN